MASTTSGRLRITTSPPRPSRRARTALAPRLAPRDASASSPPPSTSRARRVVPSRAPPRGLVARAARSPLARPPPRGSSTRRSQRSRAIGAPGPPPGGPPAPPPAPGGPSLPARLTSLLSLLDEDAVGERGSFALLLLVAVLYGSAVPVIFDPGAAEAWTATPGLHTAVRSLVAALLLLPVVLLRDAGEKNTPGGGGPGPFAAFKPPAFERSKSTPNEDPRRVARWGLEFGSLVFGATYCQWRHAGFVAPESFFLALAAGPLLDVGSRTLGPGGVPLLERRREASAHAQRANASSSSTRDDRRLSRAKPPRERRGVFSSSRVGKVSAFAAFATQETVALVGLTALALDPNQTLTFEPWGCAAALLFTWLIVRSEVLVASEGLTAKARVAAIQTGTVAALALVWAAAELDADPRFAAEGFGRPSALVSAVSALPLGPLTYLGILQAAVGVLEPAAVNRFTRGYATLAFALVPVAGAAWQGLAGGAGASLANGVGRLSWGEAIGFAVTAPPVVLFLAQAFADDRRRRRETNPFMGGEKLLYRAPEALMKRGNVGVVRGTGRFIGFRRVIDRVRGKEDRSRATAEGVFGSVVGNLLKNPAWAVKAQAKGSSAAKGASGLAAKSAAGKSATKSTLVAAGKAGKGAAAGKVGGGAVSSAAALGAGASDTGAGLDALAGLFGDGGVGASNVAATASGTKATAAATTAAGGVAGSKAAAAGAVSAAGVSAGKAASVGAALKAASLSAAAVAGAGAVAGYGAFLPECGPEDYAAVRAAAADAEGALASVAAAVSAAADVRVCAVDGGEVADIVGEGLEAVGIDPSAAIEYVAGVFTFGGGG